MLLVLATISLAIAIGSFVLIFMANMMTDAVNDDGTFFGMFWFPTLCVGAAIVFFVAWWFFGGQPVKF